MIPVLPGTGPRRQALYAELRQLIETQRIGPGSKLPPSRDLARRLCVARGAVVAAYEQLVADGYAEARIGAGTYVANQVPQPAAKPGAANMARNEHDDPASHHQILPGRLGSGTADAQTLRILRSLFRKHLSRPPDGFFHYADPQGEANLRAEIAAYLRTARGVLVDADQVLITTGTQQGLDLVIRAALQPGDSVWLEDPAYPKALAALQGNGITPIPIAVDGEGLDPALGCALAPRARAAYVTPSHQFPLGVAMTMPRRLALLDWANAANAWIFEDDYDSEFRYSGPPLACLQGMDGAGRVVYLGTFSKALVPGLRMGYMVLPESLLASVITLRDRVDRYPAALPQAVLADFLRQGHFAAHLRRARKQTRQARDALVAGLSASPCTVSAPDQGLHLIATLPANLPEARVLKLAAQAGLAGRALSALYLTPSARQGLVLGFSGFPAPALFAAAQRFSNLCAQA